MDLKYMIILCLYNNYIVAKQILYPTTIGIYFLYLLDLNFLKGSYTNKYKPGQS